jgi:hypothetical protein
MLPYLWCNLNEFPWYLVFCEDIRITVEHLSELVNVARLDIDRLLVMKMHEDFNIVAPEACDFAAIITEEYDHIRYYIAMRARYFILVTMKRVYPNSKNTTRDITILTRLDKLIEWNRKGYYEYMHTYGHPPPRPIHARTDDEVEPERIEELSKVPVPYHQYATDYAMFQMDRVYIRRDTPRQIIKQIISDAQPTSRYLPYLRKFDKLHVLLEENYTQTRSYLFEGEEPPTPFTYLRPRVVNVLRCSGYSVYVLALIRVNIAFKLHAQTRKKVEELRNVIDSLHFSEQKQHLKLTRELETLRYYRYNLRLFAFTHLSLIQRCYDRLAYSNSSLFARVMHPNPNYCLSHYKEVRPYDTRMPHEGMLPDFATWIDCVPFPNAHLPVSQTLQASCHQSFMRMLGFFMQRTAVSRVTIKQHMKMCLDNPAYKKLTAMILEVSLLGAYKHADYCPRFDQCVDLHRLFYRSHNTTRFKRWQEVYQHIVLLAMREFTAFQVKLCTPYHQYLIYTHPWWFQHCRQLNAGMNLVRLACSQKNTLIDIQRAVHGTLSRDQIAVANSPSKITALFEERYPGLFVNVADVTTRYRPKTDYLFYICKHLSVINAALANYNVNRIKLPRPFIKAIEKFVQMLPRHTPFEIEWLNTFNWGKQEELGEQVNICKTTIKLLHHAMNFIDQKQYRWLEDALFLIHRRDYEIVDAFFFNLLTHYSISVHPLSKDIAKLQAEAVARRNQTHLIPAASPWISSLVWARCCGVVKSYIAQEVTSHTLGSESVGINVTNGTYVCKQKDPFSPQKRLLKLHLQLAAELQKSLKDKSNTRLEKVCRRIRESTVELGRKRFASQSDCMDTPLVPIPLVGYVVEITSPRILYTLNVDPITNAFSICTQCGATTLFSTRMFGPNGFICGECAIAHMKAFNTPDCVAKPEKIKLNVPRHWFPVINNLPGIGDHSFQIMHVCHHCHKINTAEYSFNILFATDLRDCKLFEKHRLEFARAFADHENVNNLFDSSLSNYGSKIHAANKRKRRI